MANKDKIDNGVPLKERIERFCGNYVMTNNEMHSYRVSFVVDPAAAANWVYKKARDLMQDPEVRARIQELRDTAAQMLLISVKDLMQDWVDIAQADPNEIVTHSRVPCRYCHGEAFGYQWTEREYARACDIAMNAKVPQPLPDISGGFGYTENRDPNPLCPECFGHGHGRVRITDTAKLSPKARKLYKGAKQDRFGMVEVLLHDQEKARDSLARTLGAFKEGVPVAPVQPGTPELPENITQADAAKGYLRLVNGGVK